MHRFKIKRKKYNQPAASLPQQLESQISVGRIQLSARMGRLRRIWDDGDSDGNSDD